MHSSEYDAAKARYARMRRAAFTATVAGAVRAGIVSDAVRLTDIGETALAARRRDWLDLHPSGSGGWDWDLLSRPFRKHPSAFHVAVWSGRTLCGLAVGDALRRRSTGEYTALCIHYLEGSPMREHPLKGRIALLVVTAADAYAAALGAPILRLSSPLDGALPIYARLGFSVARAGGRAVYCVRPVLGHPELY